MTSTTGNDRLLLAAVQRAAVRLYFAQQEHIPGRQIREHLETVYELASLGLNGRRATELAAAYYGQYSTGDPTIPVLPADAFDERGPAEKLSKEAEKANSVRKLTAAEEIEAADEGPIHPEHVLTFEELRRYYAVQAAGSCAAAGASLTESLAHWILDKGFAA